MNVGFVGSPCSGKTTTAALVFAHLKDEGLLTEFVSEQARLYISRKRFQSLSPEKAVVLTDDDQEAIMASQALTEEHMSVSVGDYGVLISDASPLNSLLYMSEERRESKNVKKYIEMTVKNTDLLFFAHPVISKMHTDPNRIHSLEQSILLHRAIQPMLEKYAPDLKVLSIAGDTLTRKSQVLLTIYDRLPI
jgi:thymidylate kinase